MGLKSVIFLAVAGPLLMYGLLMSHVVYQVLTPLFQNMKLLKKITFVDHFQHAFKTPNPMPSVGGWPHHVQPDMKKAIIGNRKYIIQDLKNVFSSKMDHQKFLKIRATDDITFEDPLERIDGIDNVGHFFSMCKYLELFEFKVHKEIHSAHEILLDLELSVCIFWLKYLLEY